MNDWEQMIEISEENADYIIRRQNEVLKQIYGSLEEIYTELKQNRKEGRYVEAVNKCIDIMDKNSRLMGEMQGMELARAQAWNIYKLSLQKKRSND